MVLYGKDYDRWMGECYSNDLECSALLFSDFADITYVFIAGIFFSQTREKMHLNRVIILLLLGVEVRFRFIKLWIGCFRNVEYCCC